MTKQQSCFNLDTATAGTDLCYNTALFFREEHLKTQKEQANFYKMENSIQKRNHINSENKRFYKVETERFIHIKLISIY